MCCNFSEILGQQVNIFCTYSKIPLNNAQKVAPEVDGWFWSLDGHHVLYSPLYTTASLPMMLDPKAQALSYLVRQNIYFCLICRLNRQKYHNFGVHERMVNLRQNVYYRRPTLSQAQIGSIFVFIRSTLAVSPVVWALSTTRAICYF